MAVITAEVKAGANDGPRNHFPEGLSPGTRRFVARRRTAYDLRTSHFRAHCPFCIGLVQLRTAVCGIGHSLGSRTVGAEISVDTLNDSEEPPHNKNHGLHRAILICRASYT